MTQMTIPAFRFSANPALRLARLRCLARPAGQGLPLAALHVTLAVRVLTALVAGLGGAWSGAALATAVAVLLFVLVAAALVLTGGRRRSTTAHDPAPDRRTR